METIRIAVGSKRTPKIEAVREALSAFGPLLHPKSLFEVTGFEVETGVSHTPRRRMELMAGARGRCEALRSVGEQTAAYFVGLEGGLDVIYENGHETGRRLVFLESWAYVSDAGGRGFYGRSGAILLPEALAIEVLDRGTELSHAIEAYTGSTRRQRLAGRLGHFDEESDQPAGVVPHCRDQRLCSLLQRRALSEAVASEDVEEVASFRDLDVLAEAL